MPTNRIGFSSDFVLSNSRVGIATTNPSVTLQVAGVAKGDYHITGISTLASYGGFVSQRQNISLASTVGFTTTGIGTVGITSFISVNEVETGFVSLVGEFNTLAEDLIIDEGRIFDVSTIRNIGITTLGTQSVYVPNGSTVCVGKLESVNIGAHFSVPNGGIAARTQNPVEGMVRFNNDLNTLEFYNGVEWRQFTVTGASGRGVFMGGRLTPTNFSTISYINIHTTGNALNFGSLTSARFRGGGCSSSTRGLIGGTIIDGSTSNVIEYVTIASESNAIDFGDLTVARCTTASCSSSTRGLWAGGYSPESNVIDYVQISTLGNALDFGDLSDRGDGRGGQRLQVSSCSSSTRGLFAGGTDESPALIEYSTIDFVTIASTGNAVGGGDLISKSTQGSACSNSNRGIFAEVRTSLNSVTTNLISYVTISTLGNAIKFGDLTVARFALTSTASQIRGIFAGGRLPSPSVFISSIDYVTIMTTGNAVDFGDLTISALGISACSDSHGGLGGF